VEAGGCALSGMRLNARRRASRIPTFSFYSGAA
jgi:hypothetical protein